MVGDPAELKSVVLTKLIAPRQPRALLPSRRCPAAASAPSALRPALSLAADGPPPASTPLGSRRHTPEGAEQLEEQAPPLLPRVIEVVELEVEFCRSRPISITAG
jgi:hypothetical protein